MGSIPWWKVRIVSASDTLAEREPTSTVQLNPEKYLRNAPQLSLETVQALAEYGSKANQFDEEAVSREVYRIAAEIRRLRIEYQLEHARERVKARRERKIRQQRYRHEYLEKNRDEINARARAKRKGRGRQWTADDMTFTFGQKEAEANGAALTAG